MTFKRDGKKSHAWNKWLDAHRRELCEGGVPDAVLRTEIHWVGFLEEECDYESGWFPNMLAPAQARILHAFIQREYGDQQYRGFLRELEVILEKHAGC
jgi:hypothetical protein